MKIRRGPIGPLHTLVLCLALLCPRAGRAVEGGPEIEIEPQVIEIGSFYHGTELTIQGTLPAASKVAVVLMGPQKTCTLKRKGKVGPLWMNVGTVVVRGAPEMYYLLTSTETLEELAPPDIRAGYPIGYDELERSITFEPEPSSDDPLYPEFIKLKETLNLYKTLFHSIEMEPLRENLSRLHASLPIPPLVPPGRYTVSMYVFREGHFASNASTTLVVKKVGLPERLSVLAFQHPALYGVLAIVVAIAAGLFMGLLFGSRGKGGH